MPGNRTPHQFRKRSARQPRGAPLYCRPSPPTHDCWSRWQPGEPGKPVRIILISGLTPLTSPTNEFKSSTTSATVKFTNSCLAPSNRPAIVPGQAGYTAPSRVERQASVRPSVKMKTSQDRKAATTESRSCFVRSSNSRSVLAK